MDWDFIQEHEGVPTGRMLYNNVRPCCTRQMIMLFPGLKYPNFPVNERPKRASTFISKFLTVNGAFPAKDFRATGWMHALLGTWWAKMVTFVLRELRDLRNVGLYRAFRALQFEIPHSNFHFFVMLMYNSETNTLFTSARELGFALHEMHNISGLSLSKTPYEEYVSTAEALHIHRKESPAIYETYWEVFCHYHICIRHWSSKQMCETDVLGQVSVSRFGEDLACNSPSSQH